MKLCRAYFFDVSFVSSFFKNNDSNYIPKSLVENLKIGSLFHPRRYQHSGNTTSPVQTAAASL
jgi:hypothetical protein